MEKLSSEELRRYARHFNLSEVGLEGQEKLKNAKVLLVGAGGLGSPVALYLAAAGVGKLGLVDFDKVDESNLQRQILHDTSQVGKTKLESAKERLQALNPHIKIETYSIRLNVENAEKVFKPYDIIVDGVDNFSTRYLINDACVLIGKPLVSGAIMKFEGQLSVFNYQGGACYRCLFPEPPPLEATPSCAEAGVLGVLPGVIGTLLATEVLKIILGMGKVANDRLILYNALDLDFSHIKTKRSKNCKICGEAPSLLELSEVVQTSSVDEITSLELKSILDHVVLVDVREASERASKKIEQSLHIPLADIEKRAHELDPQVKTVVHCKLGGRSRKAALKLQELGFSKVFSLKGGLRGFSLPNNAACWPYLVEKLFRAFLTVLFIPKHNLSNSILCLTLGSRRDHD